nr:hypothetical protein [uncultured Allomuricauda sp.]
MAEDKDITPENAVGQESTAENKTGRPEPKEGEQLNPLGDELNILVSIPESLEVKMVNASILSEYEIWFFISSVLASVMSGFWVGFAQNSNTEIDSILKWNSIAFTILFGITTIVAFRYRYKLKKKSKSIKLKAKK